MPARVYTGAIIQGNERAQVIHYLAQGYSTFFVSRRFKRDYATIKAVRDAEYEEIQKRKPLLANQAERNAMLAGNLMAAELESAKPGDIPLTVLVPVHGEQIDKALLLRGDASLTIRHEHLHAHLSDSDVWDYMLKRSQQPRALPAANASPTANAHTDESVAASPPAEKGRIVSRKKSVRRP